VFLARKISRAKWSRTAELSTGEIPADAVTIDLRTSENALSFWWCDTENRAEVEDAALAIAAAGDRIDKLEVVWIAEEALRGDGQSLRNTDGRTPISRLRQHHVDVHKLDYRRLGKVAHHIFHAIENNRRLLLTKKGVTDLLMSAVKQKDVQLEDLRGGVQEEIRKALGTIAER